eukprot:15447780-Alexandrium_andersonii.AAC.1
MGSPSAPPRFPPGSLAAPPMGLAAALVRCGVARRCPSAVAPRDRRCVPPLPFAAAAAPSQMTR